MNSANEPPTLLEVASAFFKISRSDLPTDKQVLKEGLVAEAIRFSLATSEADENGWQTRHIHSLRSWVGRKLRALIPEVVSPSAAEDMFMKTLRDGVGADLLFLGDIIELGNGYYAPSPTRVVVITEEISLLVSGLPTSLFVQEGLGVCVGGISRTIQASAATLRSEFNIPIQDRASYIGLRRAKGLNEASFEAFVQGERRRSWTEAGNWTCYQGNRGGYGFNWGHRLHTISSPFGLLSLWKATEEFGITEHWLRIKHQNKDEMVRIPRPLLRQLLLLLDRWEDTPRDVIFLESEQGAVIKTQFPPPAAQTRWIHAVGGRWIGSKDGWIRWSVPRDALESTVEVFDLLPVRIK